MTNEQRNAFNRIVLVDIIPEIGSRASQMILESGNIAIDWKHVQENVFRYIAFINDDNDIEVRMVFEELFYCYYYFLARIVILIEKSVKTHSLTLFYFQYVAEQRIYRLFRNV